MTPEQAAIIDALMMQGGGPRDSVYSPEQTIQKKPETWLERQRREAAEFQDARVRAAQEGF